MLKERKEEVINQIEQQLNAATSLIVTDYRGLGVQQLAEIRNELRPLEASLLVSKNTLTRIAATRAGQEGILSHRLGTFPGIHTGRAEENQLSHTSLACSPQHIELNGDILIHEVCGQCLVFDDPAHSAGSKDHIVW